MYYFFLEILSSLDSKSRMRINALVIVFTMGFIAVPASGEILGTGTKEPSVDKVGMEKGYLPTHNYSPFEYGAMPQNWAIVQDNRGVMYFGNNEGILEFDGVTWRKIPLPDDPNIRSLSIDSNGTIYVGAQADFGYLTPDSSGKLGYHSLLEHVSEKDKDFADVWTNYVTPDGVYFQSSNKIFKWNGDTMKVWYAKNADDSKFHLMYYVHNTIYVRNRKVGLMKMIEDQLVLIQGGELFADQDIYFMTAYDDKKILLSTRFHGLYLMKPTDPDYFPKDRRSPGQINEIVPFRTQIDKFFLENFIYTGITLNNGTFAIGTQGGGVIIIDRLGRLVQILNKNTGLQDGTVFYQYLDHRNNLWLALGNGVSRIEVSAPMSYFDDNTGLEGTVQAIARHNGTLYVATLLGVFYLPPEKEKEKMKELDINNLSKYEHSSFRQVEGITTQCWDLLSFNSSDGSNLLVASNEGIHEIDDNHKVSFITKYDPWLMYHSTLDPSRVFIGCTDGLASLYWKNGKWFNAGKIDGIEASTISISEDHDENLWLSTLSEGIMKVHIISTLASGKINETEIVKYDTTHGLPSGLFYLMDAMNNTFFASEKGLFTFDGSRFELNHTFGESFVNGYLRVHRAAEDHYGNVWMETITPDDKFNLGFAKSEADNTYNWISTPFLGVSDEIIHTISHDKDGITWLGGPGGIYRYNSNIKKDYEKEFHAMIRKVDIGEDSTIFWGAYYDENNALTLTQSDKLKPVLPYEFNSLNFIYSAPSFEMESHLLFSHYLEGFEKHWSVWKKEAKANYTNLPEGKYRFRVKAINIFENESVEAIYEFKILPPWHRTIWAYISYVLSFIGFVYGAIIWSTRGLQKIIRQKTAEVVRQKEEIEEKSKDITDSINYAQKIQEAILPTIEIIREQLPESFVLFKPKDIVSGDFYWFTEKDGKALLIAADCTGHGVPGAFMSMIGNSLLNEIVNEKGITRPSEILQKLKEGVIKSLKQTGEAGKQKDGMDIALCSFDLKNSKVEYSGAYNPLFLIRDGEIQETRADRMPIGIYDDGGKVFTNHEIEVLKGDMLYFFTDGYVDQFGGPKGKKFMNKRFKQLFLDVHKKDMDEQREIMDDNIEEWKAHLDEDGVIFEQMDDILVIGVRI